MTIVRVFIDGDGSKRGYVSAQSADTDESFLAAVSRAYNASVGATPGEPDARDFIGGLLAYDGEFIDVDVDATIGQVHDYFGDVAEEDESHIDLRVDGIGGDAIELFANLYAIASAILFAKEVVGLSKKGWGAAVHKQTRDLAKDWIRTDVVSSDLRIAVFSQREWYESAFSSTFGLSLSEGVKLLKEVGYVHDRDDVWVDPSV